MLTAMVKVRLMIKPSTSPGPRPAAPPLDRPITSETKRPLPSILGGVALVAMLALGGCAATNASNENEATPSTASPPAAPATTAASAPSVDTPKPADFELTVKLLDKQCFGATGCNVEFRISHVSYTGPSLDPSATYEVSYEFKGLADTQLGTFELSGDGTYSIEKFQFGETKESAEVTAVVTAVDKI